MPRPAPSHDPLPRSGDDGPFGADSSKPAQQAHRLPRDHVGRPMLFLAVCALGVSALITQLVLMREMLSVFSGNELVLGVILGNWLLLMGLGAYLGGSASRLRQPIVALVIAQILVALLPIAAVFLLRTLRNVVFTRGAEIGVMETVTASFVLLLPYCLVAGYVLTLACRLLTSRDDYSSIGQVYFLDVIGDIVGGLLFSFLLVYVFDHFQTLYVPAVLNLAFALVVSVLARRRFLAAAAAALTIGLAAVAVRWDLEGLSTELQYPKQDVVFHGHSPYGRLVVTETAGQQTFYENGVALFSTDSGDAAEEIVHFAMAQRPQAERVLLISGGISGTVQEILKYPSVEHLDYVELDPLILDVGRAHLPDDPRLQVQNTDGRLWVKRARQADRRYDVVIVDVPDPATSQINRFYTREFFDEAKGALTPGGVLAFSLAEFEQYVTDELAELIAVAYHTAKAAFANVLMLPDGRVHFLASEGPLTHDVIGRVEAAGVETYRVRREFLEAELTPQRRTALEQAAKRPAPVNRDFSPVLYYRHLRWWISRYELRFGLLEAVLLLLVVGALVLLRPVSFAIFTTGFSASAVEVVLLVGFQILYGCVYQRVGLIVTLFMLGLALGSYMMNRRLGRWSRRDLVRLEVAIAAYSAGVPLVLMGLGAVQNVVLSTVASQVLVPALALGIAVLVGMEFPLAAKAEFRGVTGTAARLYLADYVGAALGALVVSTLLIPLIGVFAVCMVAAGLNLFSGLILVATPPRRA